MQFFLKKKVIILAKRADMFGKNCIFAVLFKTINNYHTLFKVFK